MGQVCAHELWVLGLTDWDQSPPTLRAATTEATAPVEALPGCRDNPPAPACRQDTESGSKGPPQRRQASHLEALAAHPRRSLSWPSRSSRICTRDRHRSSFERPTRLSRRQCKSAKGNTTSQTGPPVREAAPTTGLSPVFSMAPLPLKTILPGRFRGCDRKKPRLPGRAVLRLAGD